MFNRDKMIQALKEYFGTESLTEVEEMLSDESQGGLSTELLNAVTKELSFSISEFCDTEINTIMRRASICVVKDGKSYEIIFQGETQICGDTLDDLEFSLEELEKEAEIAKGHFDK